MSKYVNFDAVVVIDDTIKVIVIMENGVMDNKVEVIE